MLNLVERLYTNLRLYVIMQSELYLKRGFELHCCSLMKGVVYGNENENSSINFSGSCNFAGNPVWLRPEAADGYRSDWTGQFSGDRGRYASEICV